MIQSTFFSALSISAFLSAAPVTLASEPVSHSRWTIARDGGITCDVATGDIHQDFIEMNGEQVALVIRYGINPQGVFTVNDDVVWPMLRFYPNLTGSQLRIAFGEDARPDPDDRFNAGFFPTMSVYGGETGSPLVGRTLERVRLKGITKFDGTLNFEGGSVLAFEREIFPSIDKPAVIDTTVVTNRMQVEIALSIDEFRQARTTSAERGIYGAYTITERVEGAGTHLLRPGESTRISVIFEAHKEAEALVALDVQAQARAREARVTEIAGEMKLETPDPILNTAFAFAKLHTTESIYRTKEGLLHSPGGGRRYYAGIWANDQAEYANPFFGMLGDPIASEATLNSFRHFARYMNPEYRPIPSSIIAEGTGFWNDAGDRGDMAMIAYGAARFALARGDKQTAEELWPLIEWCLEYEGRKVTVQGVVASDHDELEGRFPAGKANLSTSSLYYDALRSATMLGGALSKNKTQLDDYAKRATAVRGAIERYFGTTVDGFETYRYYDKADLAGDPEPEVAAYATQPDALRAWIAMPLTMDIFDRKAGTIEALFSPQLWTADGLATEAGKVTYWDRATLYALRGLFAAGATERGMVHLKDYSKRRLLGDHVPYPFEAYPEGGKAQLAAESALYCRIFTEGLFGIRPTGLRSFTLTPRLPAGWPSMALRKVHAFGNVFDLQVARTGLSKITVIITRAGKPKQSYLLDPNATVVVKL
jgi:hypothetical protein